MAAFSYQEFPFLTDCVLTPEMMMTLPSSSPSSTITSPLLSPSGCFSEDRQQQPHLLHPNCSYSEPIFHGDLLQFQYPYENFQDPIDFSVHESSCVDQGTPLTLPQSAPFTPLQNWTPLNNTRKPAGDGSSLNPCKVLRVGRRKKLRKSSNGGVNEVQQVQNKTHSSYPNAAEEAPAGYIHVRARRGQATDSHSLAERARREKISERMKLLQALVPGCDKVTGKATMLDEIIHYVRSLQTQVNFLSMKLTSMNPMVYNFGVDLDALLFSQQTSNNKAPPVGSVQQNTDEANTETPAMGVGTAAGSTGYQQGQRGGDPSYIDQDNGIGSLYWGLGGQGGPDPVNQPGFSINNNSNNGF